MIVSVGILVVMLSIAGEVMSITVKATGQARALTEINQQLRIFEQTLREDLSHVDRANSVMVILANPINAYWTQDGKDADDNAEPVDGYPHAQDPRRETRTKGQLDRPRADVLMFFTARRATSNRHPRVSTTLQQVVYGHADLGEYEPDPVNGDFTLVLGSDAFPEDVDTISPIPAARWLLARRNILLSPTNPAQSLVDPAPMPTTLEDDRFLRGATDVLENFVYQDEVLTPDHTNPWYLPPILLPGSVPYARSRLDPTPPPMIAYAVNQFFIENCASFKVEWALDPLSDFVDGKLNGERQVFWIDPGALPPPLSPNDPPDPMKALHDAHVEAGASANTEKEQRLYALIYAARAGYEGEVYSLEDRVGGPGQSQLWYDAGERPNLATFTGARRKPANSDDANRIVPEDLFPGALRITIDVFDRGRRLDRPVRHVIIVPVGA
ncbi:MAG: hypothetical protein IIB60_03110 [Planctomycetes bacterium]|nr:hypothetical protein [Planctomycetota bacterium]